MDSRHSDLLDLVARLRESARRGDWNTAARLTNALPHQPLPVTPAAIDEYLRALKDALAVARASRAEAAALLHRVSAAASFQTASLVSAPVSPATHCQNFGDMPGS